jgi:outer membrane lipoprotein-sorting protein
MKRLVLTTGSLLGLILCSSCQTMEAHIMAHQAVMGLHGLKSYRGTVTERGILRDEPETLVVKKISYARLWKVRAEVTAPEDHAGELFVFDGSTLSMWWPRYYFGLRIRGVEIPPKQQIDQTILDSCYWAVENYDFSNEGATRMRGRSVREWLGEPSEPRPFRYPYRAWMDGQFNVPLKVRVEKEPGKAWYEMAMGPVEFGVDVPDETFAFEFPQDATVHDWDLQSPGVTLEEAQAAVGFPLLVPSRLPPGHRVRKVVLSRNQETQMAALIMNRAGTWLSLSELPNMGPIMVPELGIPVPIGEEEGVLNFVLGFTVVSWSVDNTALTLIGNLPYPELIQIAASVRPTENKEQE